ncbi:MAG: PorP/SprF family type IX secretion system membrane protein [Saprospiraceae bacterium]
MSKRLIPLIVLITGVVLCRGQQAPQYSMYMFNQLQFNPAYAGMDNSVNFTGVFRKQWVDLDGSPSQQSINAHLPLYFISSGFGLSFDNDQLGARTYSNLKIHYNYQIPVGRSGIFSLGFNGSVGQFGWDGSKLRSPDGNYNNGINHQDNLLPTGSVNASIFDVGLGAFYKNENIQAGVSANNILNSNIVLDDVSLYNERQYFGYLQYNWAFSNSFELLPSILLKSDLNEWQAEVSAVLRYNGNIFGGVGYRGFDNSHLDGLVFIAGFNIGAQTILGYSYDLTLSPLSSANNGSHEIILNYRLKENFGKGKLPKVIYNPRFL